LKILLFGPTGQLGAQLVPLLGRSGDLVAISHEQTDLADSDALLHILQRHRADLIVNAAAYTFVDKAESERQRTFAINASAPGLMAEWALANSARLLHFSSDYVYDGGGSEFRVESEGLGPINTYGESKLAGDEAIAASGARAIILRSSWIYSGTGRSFLSAILGRARSGDALQVVDDQVGTPTSAAWLSKTTVEVVRRWLKDPVESLPMATRVFHAAPTGSTSWLGFAQALLEEALRAGILIGDAPVSGISTADWPTPARRPLNSRLATGALESVFGILTPDWRTLVAAEVDAYASFAMRNKLNS
jgi:dTDP-4-dehydrorhamnose reductase